MYHITNQVTKTPLPYVNNRMMLKTISFGKIIFGRIRIYPVIVLIGDRIQIGGQSRRVPASRKVGHLKFFTHVAERYFYANT